MGMLAEQNPDVVSKPAAFWYDDAIAPNPQSALAYIARADFRLRRTAAATRPGPIWSRPRNATCPIRKREPSGGRTDGHAASGPGPGATQGGESAGPGQGAAQGLAGQRPDGTGAWQCWTVLASRANGLALRAKDLAVLARSVEEMYTVAETGLKALAAQPWDFMPGATELLIRSGHVEEARTCIAQMRQKDVAPQVTPYLEGLVADKQGRLRDAITDWRKAITLGYRQPVVRRLLAFALIRLGDTQSAIGELRILLTDVPGYLDGHMALARLLVQTGNGRTCRSRLVLLASFLLLIRKRSCWSFRPVCICRR